MEETYKFLKENTQVNYVSTINGDKPSCRPFGDPILFDNKNWIRINCKLIDDSNNIEAKKAVLSEFEWAEEAGYTLDNPDFQVLYISEANSTIYDEDGNALRSYKF